MLFGLTNALATFMDLVNRIVRKYLDLFVIIFIDDIFIYSTSENDHIIHLMIILNVLKDKKLFSKFRKCELGLRSVAFLGHIVSSEGVVVDLTKMKVAKSCPTPLTPTAHNVF